MPSDTPPFSQAPNDSIVDDLSELSEVEVEEDGCRRADLRIQPIETFGETSPTA
jgi:hypothetical protein